MIWGTFHQPRDATRGWPNAHAAPTTRKSGDGFPAAAPSCIRNPTSAICNFTYTRSGSAFTPRTS